jgi:hypothetical protein
LNGRQGCSATVARTCAGIEACAAFSCASRSGLHPADGVGHVLQGERDRRCEHQPAHREPPEHERDHPDERVVGENVAPPQQVEMCESEQQQHHHPRIVHAPAGLARGHRALDDEHHRSAEQDREQAAELAVDHDEVRRPHDPVAEALEAVRRRIEIGLLDHRHSDDVDREDAHDGDAADHVERKDAVGCGRRHAQPPSVLSGYSSAPAHARGPAKSFADFR